MDMQIWILGQIIIDITMITLLLWFVRFLYKRGSHNEDFGPAFRKSEIILSEMKEISQTLEKNLEQKKEIGRNILRQLDEGLKRAEESYKQIQQLHREYRQNFTHEPIPLKDADSARASIDALLRKGLPKQEIAQHLGISLGEIELLLKIRSRTDSQNRNP